MASIHLHGRLKAEAYDGGKIGAYVRVHAGDDDIVYLPALNFTHAAVIACAINADIPQMSASDLDRIEHDLPEWKGPKR
jgi:hypothetical protein